MLRLDFLDKNRSRKGSGQAGFTLVEVLVATVLLGLLAGSALWTLTQANSYAAISRLRTGAEIAAQNQIDLILSDGPFNPQNTPPEVPAELQVGTSVPQTVTIYTEPAEANGQTHDVTAQMVTTVAKCDLPPINGTDLNVYSATVVVTYTFRNKPYRVQLNTIRASDV